MPDRDTRAGSCTKSHITLVPSASKKLLFALLQMQRNKTNRGWKFYTFSRIRPFDLCIWTLQHPSRVQKSLPQGGDISISPPCEELSVYFIKAPPSPPSLLLVALPTCRNTTECKHYFHSAYTKRLQKVKQICSWRCTQINAGRLSSAAKLLLSVFALILRPLMSSFFLICLWNIDFFLVWTDGQKRQAPSSLPNKLFMHEILKMNQWREIWINLSSGHSCTADAELILFIYFLLCRRLTINTWQPTEMENTVIKKQL